MRKFLAALLLAFACVFSMCCAPHAGPAPAAPPKLERVFPATEWTIHADVDVSPPGRLLVTRAASSITRLTRGRIEMRVEYDLDFSDTPATRAHIAAAHNSLVLVDSSFDIVEAIDAHLGPGAVAATLAMKNGSRSVILILDRIAEEDFESTVMHEFGHVIGLDDLPAFDAVMSGTSDENHRPPSDWTPADRATCVAHKLCD